MSLDPAAGLYEFYWKRGFRYTRAKAKPGDAFRKPRKQPERMYRLL